MAVNQAVFSDLAAQAQSQGRRMTLAEAMQAGIPEEDYHKIYGSPDTNKFAAAQKFYEGRGERIPVKALVEMGYDPIAIPKIYGTPPVQSLGDLYGQEQQRVRTANDVAVRGTRGEKENFGTAREINTTVLRDAPLMQAANIAPVATVNDVQLGSAVGANAANIDPSAQLARLQIGAAERLSLENAFRAKQEGLANELAATSRGERPSLAAAQLSEATDRNNAQAAGLISAQRGVNAGLATRLAVNQAGDANQEAVMKGSQLRLAEAIAARQELAGLSNQARGQDTVVLAANQAAGNEFRAKQAEMDMDVNAANAQALNARAATQAQLQQQSGQFSAEATNARAVAQGDISARLQLANQLAINNQNTTQAQLQQQANQGNQAATLNTQLQQGTLNQATNVVNQTAVNTMESNRAQTAAGVKQSGIAAGGTVAAAGAAAAGTVAAANINASAAVMNNTVDNLTGLQIAGMESGSNFGNQVSQYNQAMAENEAQIMASGTQAGGDVASMESNSDERSKKDISFADPEIEKFLSALEAKKYDYKDTEKNGRGEKIGVMAQDLEDTDIGNSFVRETKDGKVVDYGQGLGVMMASLASLNRRLQSLEGGA